MSKLISTTKTYEYNSKEAAVKEAQLMLNKPNWIVIFYPYNGVWRVDYTELQ